VTSPVAAFVRVLDSDALAPGVPTAVEVQGLPVCVVRLAGGVFAFEDRCPHRGTPLSQGTLCGSTLTCRAHTWEFDVRTGELLRLRAPASLRMLGVREVDGAIEVAAA
jgi:nitrite reductase/ring-hydroxylating ferredoxin subunit